MWWRSAGSRQGTGAVISTFTTDLQRLADWLVACRITSVALESTGIFWIPIYEILEARGSDVSDAEWLRDLHSVGLLRASFRPTPAIVTLRTACGTGTPWSSSRRCMSNGCRRR